MSTRRAPPVLALVALLLACSPAAADSAKEEALALQDEATRLYKHKQFSQAAERIEQAYRLTPGNHELLRMLGACRAMVSDTEGAYEAYREYVHNCPGCMYAPQVRTIIRQYEEATDRPLTPRPPDEEAREAEARARSEAIREAERQEPPPLTTRDELMARRMLANARAIKAKNPLGALANCLEALRRLPRSHPLHDEARELYQEIAWMPAPPLEAAEPGAHPEEPPLKRAKRLYEEAYVIKATNPGLAIQKLLEAIDLTPADDIYHSKSEKLLERIENGED